MAGALALLLLFLALGAVAALMFLLGGNRTPDRSAGKQPGENSSAPKASGPATSRTFPPPVVLPPPGPGATSPAPQAGLPTGWVRYTDPAFGYSYGHPADWKQRTRKDGIEFVDPNGGGYVRVDSQPARSSALAALRAQATTFRASYPGYQQLQLKTVPISGYDDAAVWEFTFPVTGSASHGLDLNLITGGRGYAVYFQKRDSAWASSREELTAFFASFRPGR